MEKDVIYARQHRVFTATTSMRTASSMRAAILRDAWSLRDQAPQDEVRICWTVFWTEERSNKLSPHPEEPSRSEGVSKDGRSETVIYGIYGGEARKIRPDFNVLIIDDGTSTLPLRPQASGIGHRASGQTLANVIYGIYARQNKW